MIDGIAKAHACSLPVQGLGNGQPLLLQFPGLRGESQLVDLDRNELLEALASIGRLRKRFPVMNPGASLAAVARYVCGEPQTVPCIGGYKYFYFDWNLDIWRCEALEQAIGFGVRPRSHSGPARAVPRCMMGCYRMPVC
jgi:hypothetical protein